MPSATVVDLRQTERPAVTWPVQAILTNCVVAIIDWTSTKQTKLPRHGPTWAASQIAPQRVRLVTTSPYLEDKVLPLGNPVNPLAKHSDIKSLASNMRMNAVSSSSFPPFPAPSNHSSRISLRQRRPKW
jgi:hypothetical protein